MAAPRRNGPGATAAPPWVDVPRLSRYVRAAVPGAGDDDRPLELSLLAGGRSNLTFLLSIGQRRWVLRRPPLGHVLPTAHDMAREFRVLSALQPTSVPVPRVHAWCDDASLVGAPFYVMEWVDGRIVRTAEDAASLTPDEATRCSNGFLDVLAEIHSVDYRRVGLDGFGRPDGYLERQVRRWMKQWERSRQRDLPAVDELARRLLMSVPATRRTAVVHGDYRLDNVVFAHRQPHRPLAVLDWEMATVGDPLADLGLLLVYWAEPGNGHPSLPVATGVTAQPGFLTRAQVVEHYAAASGADVDALDFYVVLGYFKLAIIFEGIHARHRQGNTLGDGFDGIGDSVPELIDAALQLADRSPLLLLRG